MKKALITLLPVMIVVFSFQEVMAQNQQLHAVFINSFIKYIKWPDKDSKGDFKIAVIGESQVTPHLLKLAEIKKVDGRTIVVQHYESLDNIKNVHIVYISHDRSSLLNEALRTFKRSSALIITEKDGLGAKGSNINFISRNGKVAFEINMEAMEKSKLKVATELKRLAIEI